MTIKNLPLLFLLFLSLCSFQKGAKPVATKPVLKVEVIGWVKVDNTDYLSVKASFTNDTKDTVKYLSMTCSWIHGFAIESSDYILKGVACEKNAATFIKIAPGKTDERIINLDPLKMKDQMHNTEFKLGIHYVNKKDVSGGFDVVQKLQDMSNVIWAETTEVK